MEILRKKLILWLSVGFSMIIVLVIWAMSWKTYNFSDSAKQVKELRQEVQEKIQSVGAGHVLPSKKKAIPELELPLEE